MGGSKGVGLQGIVMRTATLAIFLVVAVHGLASASPAFASPEASVSADPQVSQDANRVGPSDAKDPSQPSLTAQTERKPVRSEPEVLSSNFARPKPVQIYWFF